MTSCVIVRPCGLLMLPYNRIDVESDEPHRTARRVHTLAVQSVRTEQLRDLVAGVPTHRPINSTPVAEPVQAETGIALMILS